MRGPTQKSWAIRCGIPTAIPSSSRLSGTRKACRCSENPRSPDSKQARNMVQVNITQGEFGTLPDGRRATLYTLVNPNGLIVKISDFGGVITEIHTPDRDGKFADINLG